MSGKSKKLKAKNRSLRKLIRHIWVYSSYDDCGYRKMDEPMRRLYAKVTGVSFKEKERELQK